MQVACKRTCLSASKMAPEQQLLEAVGTGADVDIKILRRQGAQDAAHSCARGVQNCCRDLQCKRSGQWIQIVNNHSRVQGTMPG